jgi:hypothetical protein
MSTFNLGRVDLGRNDMGRIDLGPERPETSHQPTWVYISSGYTAV